MIEFEKWFHTNLDSLNEDTQGLFEDSIKCFKYDIDRPAYLSAYQGMLCHLRDVMRKSKRPESFEDGEWQDKLKKISKNSTWDNAIFDCIKQKPNSGKKSAVFSMPEELRGEFDYWRNLRNACAHYKEHELTKAHVQTLYTFIQEHLLSITVEGGMRTLLAEFMDYCDPAKTSEAEPVEPLVNKITLMVSPNEMNTFFEELLKIYVHCRYRDEWQLIDCLMTDSKVKCYFETYVKETESLRMRMIYHKPENALVLLSTEKEFHELWYEITDYPNERNIDVFICLLEAEKVDDIKIANARLCDSLYQNGSTISFTTKSIALLQYNGYFEIFINIILR